MRTDIRVFDADHMARLDTDMWRSYYDKKPVALHLQLGQVLRDEFHMTLARSYVTAFRAAHAAHAPGDLSRSLALAAGRSIASTRSGSARTATSGRSR